MKNNKKGILDQLYLLRALLSKVSQNKDKLVVIDKKREEWKNKKFVPSISQSNPKETFENNKKEILNAKVRLGQLEKEFKELSNKENEIRTQIQNKERLIAAPYSRKDGIFGICFFLVITILPVFFLFKWWINKNYSFWIGLLLFPVLIVAVFLDYIAISISTKKSHESSKNRYNKELDALVREREGVVSRKIINTNEQANIREKIKLMEQLKMESVQKQKSIEEECARKEFDEFYKIKQQKLNEFDNSQLTIINENKVIFEQLKNFDINERDWPILDLIIYEIETGRADSIKEALQQADLYVRHNEIKEFVQAATLMICSTIEKNTFLLRDSIKNSLSQIQYEISELNQTNTELSAKFEELIDAQKLNNALLDKANVSSEQLADDVRRMRRVTDAEYYGYRV